MRWGGLLVEAKLTESDFQTREARIVEAYRILMRFRTGTSAARRDTDCPAAGGNRICRGVYPGVGGCCGGGRYGARVSGFACCAGTRGGDSGAGVCGVSADPQCTGGVCGGVQLLRDPRPAAADLREAWFAVMAAVKSAQMRVRCKVLTWQELAGLAPEGLREFLNVKYGIAAPGCGS